MQCADFIEEMPLLLSENVPVHVCKSMCCQHYGAHTHLPSQVYNWLDNFLDGWFGYGGPVTWTPHSPDLTHKIFIGKKKLVPLKFKIMII
jgi:hypothetical protein